MLRSELQTLPEYFDKYILMNEDVSIAEAIQSSIDDLNNAPLALWKKIGDKVYAPGKWTIKEVLQHITDAERVFSYRALSFARGDEQLLPSFDEDTYAANAETSERDLDDILDELIKVHQSTKSLFSSFNNNCLKKEGMGFKGLYSVASIGFIIPGHQKWHLNIIKERYMPLVS